MVKIRLLDILLVLLFLLVVYLVLTRLFGHSATDISISIGFFTILGSLLYNLNREFGEFKIKSINSFQKINSDMKIIKQEVIDIKIIKEDIKLVKNKLNI